MKNFPLRMLEELHEQIKEIAEEEGRSMNKQICWVMKNYVREYLDSKLEKPKRERGRNKI